MESQKIYPAVPENVVLPSWSSSDLDRFIATNPVYGPQAASLRTAAQIAGGSALVGGLGSFAFFQKNSRNPIIAGVFALLSGAVSAGISFQASNWNFGIVNPPIRTFRPSETYEVYRRWWYAQCKQ